MKPLLFVFLVSITASCSGPFSKPNVLKHKAELEDLVTELASYGSGTYDRDDIDEFLIQKVRSLNIDLIVKNVKDTNPYYNGFFEAKDSLLIFIKYRSEMFDTEKRIIYDFNKDPLNYGSQQFTGAAYEILQLDERWYYSEVGFD